MNITHNVQGTQLERIELGYSTKDTLVYDQLFAVGK